VAAGARTIKAADLGKKILLQNFNYLNLMRLVTRELSYSSALMMTAIMYL
jgi:hypothetical protein